MKSKQQQQQQQNSENIEYFILASLLHFLSNEFSQKYAETANLKNECTMHIDTLIRKSILKC